MGKRLLESGPRLMVWRIRFTGGIRSDKTGEILLQLSHNSDKTGLRAVGKAIVPSLQLFPDGLFLIGNGKQRGSALSQADDRVWICGKVFGPGGQVYPSIADPIKASALAFRRSSMLSTAAYLGKRLNINKNKLPLNR